MRIQLIHHQRESKSNGLETILTHIKSVDDFGKYIKFEKITNELLSRIRESIIIIPPETPVPCPKCKRPTHESTNNVFGVDYYTRQCEACHFSYNHKIMPESHCCAAEVIYSDEGECICSSCKQECDVK